MSFSSSFHNLCHHSNHCAGNPHFCFSMVMTIRTLGFLFKKKSILVTCFLRIKSIPLSFRAVLHTCSTKNTMLAACIHILSRRCRKQCQNKKMIPGDFSRPTWGIEPRTSMCMVWGLPLGQAGRCECPTYNYFGIDGPYWARPRLVYDVKSGVIQVIYVSLHWMLHKHVAHNVHVLHSLAERDRVMGFS